MIPPFGSDAIRGDRVPGICLPFAGTSQRQVTGVKLVGTLSLRIQPFGRREDGMQARVPD